MEQRSPSLQSADEEHGEAAAADPGGRRQIHRGSNEEHIRQNPIPFSSFNAHSIHSRPGAQKARVSQSSPT